MPAKNPASQAVGSHEAAALLGVHHTIVGKMAARGLLEAQILAAAHVTAPTKKYAIYDGEECDRNFREYEDSRAESSAGRPRAWLHMRPEAIKHLAKLKHPIAFADAIGPAEAAEILGVHCSFLTRLVNAGKIIGRRPWSPKARGKLAQNYIYSRASCRANVRLVRQMQADGGKIGRPRKLS